jgi:hypothetical protein
MKTTWPDVELMMLLQKAVLTLCIDHSFWPPVSSNGPGHARYRRVITTDRANARRIARHYGEVLQESLPWATVQGIVAYFDDCDEPELEGLQRFHLILAVRQKSSVVGDAPITFLFSRTQQEVATTCSCGSTQGAMQKLVHKTLFRENPIEVKCTQSNQTGA